MGLSERHDISPAQWLRAITWNTANPQALKARCAISFDPGAVYLHPAFTKAVEREQAIRSLLASGYCRRSELVEQLAQSDVLSSGLPCASPSGDNPTECVARQTAWAAAIGGRLDRPTVQIHFPMFRGLNRAGVVLNLKLFALESSGGSVVMAPFLNHQDSEHSIILTNANSEFITGIENAVRHLLPGRESPCVAWAIEEAYSTYPGMAVAAQLDGGSAAMAFYLGLRALWSGFPGRLDHMCVTGTIDEFGRAGDVDGLKVKFDSFVHWRESHGGSLTSTFMSVDWPPQNPCKSIAAQFASPEDAYEKATSFRKTLEALVAAQSNKVATEQRSFDPFGKSIEFYDGIPVFVALRSEFRQEAGARDPSTTALGENPHGIAQDAHTSPVRESLMTEGALAASQFGRITCVTAPPGCGKSFLLRRLFNEAAAKFSTGGSLPIWLHASQLVSRDHEASLVESGGLMKRIASRCSENLEESARSQVLSYLLSEFEYGNCLLFVDGWDELKLDDRTSIMGQLANRQELSLVLGSRAYAITNDDLEPLGERCRVVEISPLRRCDRAEIQERLGIEKAKVDALIGENISDPWLSPLVWLIALQLANVSTASQQLVPAEVMSECVRWLLNVSWEKHVKQSGSSFHDAGQPITLAELSYLCYCIVLNGGLRTFTLSELKDWCQGSSEFVFSEPWQARLECLECARILVTDPSDPDRYTFGHRQFLEFLSGNHLCSQLMKHGFVRLRTTILQLSYRVECEETLVWSGACLLSPKHRSKGRKLLTQLLHDFLRHDDLLNRRLALAHRIQRNITSRQWDGIGTSKLRSLLVRIQERVLSETKHWVIDLEEPNAPLVETVRIFPQSHVPSLRIASSAVPFLEHRDLKKLRDKQNPADPWLRRAAIIIASDPEYPFTVNAERVGKLALAGIDPMMLIDWITALGREFDSLLPLVKRLNLDVHHTEVGLTSIGRILQGSDQPPSMEAIQQMYGDKLSRAKVLILANTPALIPEGEVPWLLSEMERQIQWSKDTGTMVSTSLGVALGRAFSTGALSEVQAAEVVTALLPQEEGVESKGYSKGYPQWALKAFLLNCHVSKQELERLLAQLVKHPEILADHPDLLASALAGSPPDKDIIEKIITAVRTPSIDELKSNPDWQKRAEPRIWRQIEQFFEDIRPYVDDVQGLTISFDELLDRVRTPIPTRVLESYVQPLLERGGLPFSIVELLVWSGYWENEHPSIPRLAGRWCRDGGATQRARMLYACHKNGRFSDEQIREFGVRGVFTKLLVPTDGGFDQQGRMETLRKTWSVIATDQVFCQDLLTDVEQLLKVACGCTSRYDLSGNAHRFDAYDVRQGLQRSEELKFQTLTRDEWDSLLSVEYQDSGLVFLCELALFLMSALKSEPGIVAQSEKQDDIEICVSLVLSSGLSSVNDFFKRSAALCAEFASSGSIEKRSVARRAVSQFLCNRFSQQSGWGCAKILSLASALYCVIAGLATHSWNPLLQMIAFWGIIAVCAATFIALGALEQCAGRFWRARKDPLGMRVDGMSFDRLSNDERDMLPLDLEFGGSLNPQAEGTALDAAMALFTEAEAPLGLKECLRRREPRMIALSSWRQFRWAAVFWHPWMSFTWIRKGFTIRKWGMDYWRVSARNSPNE